MRRMTAVLAAALLLLAIVPATAFAAKATNVHATESGTDVDPDYCGSGVTIDISFTVTFTDHLGKGDTFKSTANGKFTFTNPATGDSVLIHFAQQFTDELVSGDPDGLHTVSLTYKGLPDQVRAPHGGVLLRDAGYITFVDTYDGDVLLSSTITVNKGPHPEADSDFALFCEVTTEALGIS